MSSDLSVTNQAAQPTEPAQSVPLVPIEQRWFGLCVLVLLGATLPLWTGQANFPRIPMLLALSGGGSFVDLVLLATTLTILVGLIVGHLLIRRARLSAGMLPRVWAALLVVLTLFVLRDQNRLQPWVWHAMLVSAYSIGTCYDRARWRKGMLVLTVAIYGWSAISKFDSSFANSYGQQLLEAMLGSERLLSFRMLKPEDRAFAARLLPTGELLTAVLMLIPITRRFGCLLSIVMHLGLMLAVGPLGLNHRAGVFLWNIYFIGQNAQLWWHAARTRQPAVYPVVSNNRLRFANAVLVFAVLFPALRSVGWCDNWPAWAVYASDIEQVTIYVRDSAFDQLPERVRPFAEPTPVKTGWTAIRIEQWSLAECHVPIYPQDRFYIAVALALASDAKLDDDDVLVHRKSRPRRDGQRDHVALRGAEEVRRFASRFWLNTKAVR